MKRMLAVLSIVLLSAIFIMGCDGGDNAADAPVSAAFAPENAVVLTGVVAMERPLRGVVQAINTYGETSDEVRANPDGSFSLEISNHAPFMLRMIHPNRGVELFSFAAGEGHVNVTPLTNLAMHVAAGAGANLSSIFHDWDGSQLSPEEVQMAAATVNANLASLLRNQGLDPKTYDFFQTDFKTNGADAVLNIVRIRIDSTAKTLNDSIQILDAAGRQLTPFDASDMSVAPSASPESADPKADEPK